MKKRKGLKIFGSIVGIILVLMAVINIIPPKKNVAENLTFLFFFLFFECKIHRNGPVLILLLSAP